jgi:prophage DNA circulation protein
MDTVFTAAYIMREARRIDASGEEAQRRRDIVDFRISTAELQKTKALAKTQKVAKKLQENLARELVPPSQMAALTIALIHDQLDAYRARGVPNLLTNTKYPLKADKLTALKEAEAWYRANMVPSMVAVVPVLVPDLVPAIVEGWRDEEEAEMEDKWRSNSDLIPFL